MFMLLAVATNRGRDIDKSFRKLARCTAIRVRDPELGVLVAAQCAKYDVAVPDPVQGAGTGQAVFCNLSRTRRIADRDQPDVRV